MNIYCLKDFERYVCHRHFLNIHEIRMDFVKYSGQAYHSCFGFNWESEIYIDRLDDLRMKFWSYYDDGHYDDDDDTELCVLPSKYVLKEEAQTSLPYRKVILMYCDPNYWREKPRFEWYNKFSRVFGRRAGIPTEKMLEYLQARGYIKILDPFMKIEIDADYKGCPITYDDILFAGRGLCMDETRTYDNFMVLPGSTDDILYLEPEIDNWST